MVHRLTKSKEGVVEKPPNKPGGKVGGDRVQSTSEKNVQSSCILIRSHRGSSWFRPPIAAQTPTPLTAVGYAGLSSLLAHLLHEASRRAVLIFRVPNRRQSPELEGLPLDRYQGLGRAAPVELSALPL